MKQQSMMLLVFISLLFLDCVTRWMAISYGRLKEMGTVDVGLWRVMMEIPAARRAGLISSQVMKRRGIEKMVLYFLTVMSAAGADFMLKESGGVAYLSEAVIGYLAVTEFLSIIENLSDAGVESMGRLIRKLVGKE